MMALRDEIEASVRRRADLARSKCRTPDEDEELRTLTVLLAPALPTERCLALARDAISTLPPPADDIPPITVPPPPVPASAGDDRPTRPPTGPLSR